MNSLLYLAAADVERACHTLDPVAVVTAAFLAIRDGRAAAMPEAAIRWTAADGTAARSLALPARHDHWYGCKVINACVGNPARGLPRAHGLVLLFDPDTAAPVAIMEGGYISALRTAAVSVAALLATRDAGPVRLAFLGCGRLARAHARLLATRVTVTRATVFDLVPDRAAAFASDLRDDVPDSSVDIVDNPQAAMRDADVVVAVTTSTTPYAPLDWLAMGATFLNVSLDDAAEDMLTGCDHLFVDDWALVSDDDTRLLGRLARAGRMTGPGTAPPPGGRAVDAELPELLAGTYHRPVTGTDRVVINPFGLGVHDIAFAGHVYDHARAVGAGTRLARGPPVAPPFPSLPAIRRSTMFDDDNADYFVVINDEEQYSIWPVDRDIPLGWTAVGPAQRRQAALDHIEEVWTDMRPRSLREAMERATTTGT
jgi:ornithine cyclodeaminase/alanine dehydrogenase-like protein (mu-crystallin family)/uncharacterized protein YbdZ (MbtH family)